MVDFLVLESERMALVSYELGCHLLNALLITLKLYLFSGTNEDFIIKVLLDDPLDLLLLLQLVVPSRNHVLQQLVISLHLPNKVAYVPWCTIVPLSHVLQLLLPDHHVVDQRHLLVKREAIPQLSLRLIWLFADILRLGLSEVAVVHLTSQSLCTCQVGFDVIVRLLFI